MCELEPQYQLEKVAKYVSAECGDDGFDQRDTLADSIIRKIKKLEQEKRDLVYRMRMTIQY